MGVRQKANVEHQINVEWNSVLVTEGFNRKLHDIFATDRSEQTVNLSLQLMHIERCCINDQIG